MDAGGGGVPTPAMLRDQTVALSDRQPMAFLALAPGHDGIPEVAVIHRILRYMDSPGEDPSGYNDRVVGLLGDILPHQYPAVEVLGTAFHPVGTAVRVPTVAAMDTLVPTWGDPTVALGPYVEADPETEVVRPRYLQLIPGRYAALLIHRRRIRAKQAYQELVGAIRADGTMAACQDMLVWLRAACTARGGGGAQTTQPSVLQTFAPLHLPPEVYRYLTAKVQGDLPALGEEGGAGGAATAATLAGALRAITTGRLDEEGAPRAREVKTIMDAYKETYVTLLRYGNVTRSDDVAPLWTRLANCSKSEQHTVLSQEFQKICMARGLSTELYTPIVTTTLKQMIVGLQFAGHGSDDLTSGCQPFLVAYSGSAHHYQAVAAASIANQLAQGEQTASLSDYRTIREKEKVKFPRDVSEVCITLFRYAVLCHSLFQGAGGPHPFVEAMWKLASNMQNSAPFIAERFAHVSRTPHIANTYFARIVRAVQLSAHGYLQQVATSGPDGVPSVELPMFAPMLQDLKRGTFHLSTNWIAIPGEYLEPVPANPTTGSTASTVASTISTLASARTTVSALTDDTRPSLTRLENPAPDAAFTSIVLRPGSARVLFRTNRPPFNDAGQELCVSWWTKSSCFPNCGRRATHVPFASTAERARLLEFVQTHFAAPAPLSGT